MAGIARRIAKVATRGPTVTKALEGRAEKLLRESGETAFDPFAAPAKKPTKKQLELEAKKAGIRGVQERRQLQPGKNFQPLINPTEEELGAIRLQHGGHGSNLPPKELEAQLKETYVDPNIRANIPEPQPRTREQKALPRTVTPVQSPRIQDLIDNPAVRQRIMEAARAGESVSGWYDTTPLQKMFHDEFGPDEGQQRFSDFIGMVAGTSTGNKIGPNIRTASNYYNQKYGGGRDIAQDPFVRGLDVQERVGGDKDNPLYGPKYADVPAAYEVPPPLYGSDKQQTHMHNMNTQARGGGDVLGGGYDTMDNPKIAAFYENLMGNWQPTTIDKHAMRLGAMASGDPRFLTEQGAKQFEEMTTAGLPQEAIMAEMGKRATNWTDIPDTAKGEYDALEQYWNSIADEMGITPAQLQAQAWVGGGEQTGLGSPGITFMDAFKDRVRRTSIKHNIPPDQVLKLMMHGKMTLAELEGGGSGTMTG
ncbi:MAG: hypothetical protein ABWY64_19930 [Tardiphaga sp.]